MKELAIRLAVCSYFFRLFVIFPIFDFRAGVGFCLLQFLFITYLLLSKTPAYCIGMFAYYNV